MADSVTPWLALLAAVLICVGLGGFVLLSSALRKQDDGIDRAAPIIAEPEKTGVFCRRLRALSRMRRMDAAVRLGAIGGDTARVALENALEAETNWSVKLYIANALSDIRDPRSIPALVTSLLNAHRWYRRRVNMLLADYGDAFRDFLPKIRRSHRVELSELIVDFASVAYSSDLATYLLDLIDTKEERGRELKQLYGRPESRFCANCRLGEKGKTDPATVLCRYYGEVENNFSCMRYQVLPVSLNPTLNHRLLVYQAAEVLAVHQPEVLAVATYLDSQDPEIRKAAVKALGELPNDKRNLLQLVFYLKDEPVSRVAIGAIAEQIEKYPEALELTIKIFKAENDPVVKRRLAEILSYQMEYLLSRMSKRANDGTDGVVRQILWLGRTSEIIHFANTNQDKQLEDCLIPILCDVATQSPKVRRDCVAFLNPRILRQCGMAEDRREDRLPPVRIDLRMIGALRFILVGAVVLMGLAYLLVGAKAPGLSGAFDHIRQFSIGYLHVLSWYLIIGSAISAVILLGALCYSSRQRRLWRLKSHSLLRKQRMLPSLSIIAPAYNEEEGIIERVNGLLHLDYPDHDVVVINDGSTDRTLSHLIEHFNLVRIDFESETALPARPLRGIYINRALPGLIVVDKEPGGKPDAVNAGISLSEKDYCFVLDSRTVPEKDTALKLAAQILDEDSETPVVGGNVFPINSCRVESGLMTEPAVSGRPLILFQMLEMVRQVTGLRMGWAAINSLVIPAAAFGLIRRERILQAGGYLTNDSRLARGSDGEDMELIVRIRRMMRQRGLKHRIRFAANACCWAKVAENRAALLRQRHIRQRNLIEILTLHWRMIGNPAHGTTGLLAMPYHLVFEMIGPLLESFGYILLLCAALAGWLDAGLVALLLIAIILSGLFVSLLSLLQLEKSVPRFGAGEMARMVGYAVLNNLGWQQHVQIGRAAAYLKIIFTPAPLANRSNDADHFAH